MTGRFYEITPEIMELANKCSASSIIPSELYKQKILKMLLQKYLQLH